ncbi:MAG: vitamin B12-dependent ribonucleotide reductase [Candidatus Heimdallarchaeota archaeon]|nr:vitamin B12-dependent ribonucleotide reductase [Candidatus Heimdallarchaeota archaeon]
MKRRISTISNQELKFNLTNGLTFDRVYSQENNHPYETVEWSKRDVKVTSFSGDIIFEQNKVEFPKFWSQNSVQIVTSKYFHGKLNTSDRESSLKQLIDRVVLTLKQWGMEGGYFADSNNADIFADELTDIIMHQRMAFNSPVWFNLGTVSKPQGSACFINSVEDNMNSILELAKTEGMIFKYGSGSGVNLSPLRSKGELLSTGGTSSGPLSFMKGYDSFAGSIKSGGKTRRAAKMVLLDDTHPDVIEFIESKEKEEKKAWALIDAGYDGSFTGEAYSSVFFQNANHSVRVSDEFMEKVVTDGTWNLVNVNDGEVRKTVKAKDMLDRISEATHVCGDPGLQYRTTINKWHTCKNSGMINASNPCSEYVFLDDTACNLASINLLQYRNQDGSFDVERFMHTVRVTITAMEIIVGRASYPTEKIERNSHLFRTLGIGYTNLGALIMSLGYPYDSNEGRNIAAAITSVMSGTAYLQSSKIAENLGSFEKFAENREPMLEVMQMHKDATKTITKDAVDDQLYKASKEIWKETLDAGWQHGYRNAQISVLAPTGTISFMMDADTTGIEPEIALIKFKKLVGGGHMSIVNNTVPLALTKLGYNKSDIDKIVKYIDKNGTIEGCEILDEEHLPVFDCSIKARKGKRSIHHMGHIKMMASVQPFLSGAISKTVNMPEDCKIEEISDAYIKGWEMGLKAIAIYRDNSKRLQPLNTGKEDDKKTKDEKPKVDASTGPIRRRMPETRSSKIHKFEVNGHEGYIIVGMYNNGQPGEVFIKMSKQGSTLGGVMDSLAVLISISLQYGVPLSVLTNKFKHTKFEPSGMTSNPKIPIASSIIDYIFRWMALEFNDDDSNGEYADFAEYFQEEEVVEEEPTSENVDSMILDDNQICTNCGGMAVRSGSCYACPECGTTSGCS